MKVLVVGGGGREHALVRKIKESKKVDEIFCTPGNGGISYDAKCFDVAATDIEGVVNLAKEIKADLVVVAPDDPLVAGMVDALNEAGFKTFGPRANAAIIEGSKVFSKELMQKYNIPTAEYKVFDNAEEAIEYIKERNEFPTVIKAMNSITRNTNPAPGMTVPPPRKKWRNKTRTVTSMAEKYLADATTISTMANTEVDGLYTRELSVARS